MKKQIFILLITVTAAFFCLITASCDLMASLFHGPEPLPSYTVKYNGNGASGTAPSAQTVEIGTVINLPDKGSLTSGGNVFAGWSESSTGTDAIYSIGSAVTVNKDMVFYAQWFDSSTPQYTVSFNANGASGGMPPASQTVYNGISITVPGQGMLSYSGKIFAGWNTHANGAGTNYTQGAAFKVTANVTLYAKWQSPIQYTVSFNRNGASGANPSSVTVDPGTIISLPGEEGMTYSGRLFKGWNTQSSGSGTNYEGGSSYTINSNAVLYAHWEIIPVVPPGNTLVEQLAYVRNYTGNGTVFDIVVYNNVNIGATSVTTMGINITVNIRSVSSEDVKTIQLDGQGHLFSIDTGITMRLQDIVLRGHSNNNKALVSIGNGKLILNSGTKITENTNTIGGDGFGGGIRVIGGTLEINDGAEISKNTVRYKGGGIYIENNGTVYIRGGIITENMAEGYSIGLGGGIFINSNSTVSMSGGIISKNKVSGSPRQGAGIYVESGSSFLKRAATGIITSGIIYGSSGTEANLIISTGSDGNAIYRNFGTLKTRNTTLGPGDEISTGNDVGWQ